MDWIQLPMPLHTGEVISIVFTLLAIIATLVPFTRGFRVCLQAWQATRAVPVAQLEGDADAPADDVEPVSSYLVRLTRKALQDSEGHPDEFVFDASQQHVLSEYDTQFASLISMYAGILPPLGFVGTTLGLLILFVSMRITDTSLEFGAVALALISSVVALVGFGILESLRIRLYGRMLDGVADARRALEA
jgi:hypothetical protein